MFASEDENLDDSMKHALRMGPGALAIACADVRAGWLLGASAHGNEEREAAANAAACAAKICSLPPPASGEDHLAGEAGGVVGSGPWVHAYARVARRPELVVVGVARGDVDVALLVDWLRRVAGELGRESSPALHDGSATFV